MKLSKFTAMIFALATFSLSAISASAVQDLTPTDASHKFSLGSDDTGGSGVEPEGSDSGQNWIKVVQSSNPSLKLFEDIGPEVNVTALAVTFEISDWSGTEFSVSWGGNIDFFNDASTTWCGTDAFSGISEYTIAGNGEYTLICDLAAMTSAQGKEGISHMQTCEMVIGNVADGDTTQIEIKSARIYIDGETPEQAVIPEDSGEDSTSDESGSESDSAFDSAVSSSSADSQSSSTAASASGSAKTTASANGTSTAKNNTASTESVSASDNTNSDTGAAEGITLAILAVLSAAIVVSKKK